MAKKQFKTESKKLLDMMINSIYTNREIFLRELISNASDAIDKLYFRSLTDQTVKLNRDDYEIRIESDKDARTITVSDNGCGMTAEELEKNLGTIAKSGSFDFKTQDNKSDEKDGNKDKIDIIGQFGVGFYSAFMVSDKITVITKAYGEESATKWESSGVDGYTVTPCEKETNGTDIILHIKDNTEEDYGQFLESYKLRELVKKYSDYIHYPIRSNVAHQHLKDGTENEYETVYEDETFNSMTPIWKKEKSKVKNEEYNSFYRDKFAGFDEPLKVIRQKAEGTSNYIALLFIPSKAPFGYYSRDYEKGLQLYSSGVLITDKCKELIPDYFSFVKGLVDSSDLSLNISRETLQQDRQLQIIGKAIEKKITTELKRMLKSEREKYEEFFKEFGTQLKFGVYSDYGMHKETLQDLLLFPSSDDKKLVTLDEYVTGMKDGQEKIYYASGETLDMVSAFPQVKTVVSKGYDVLLLTDDIDEFALQAIQKYSGKDFCDVCKDNPDFSTDEEKEALKKANKDNKEMLDYIKQNVGDTIQEVRFTNALDESPVCLSSDGMLSFGMEKVLNKMPGNTAGLKAEIILEINLDHPIAEKLKKLFADDKDALADYAKILYGQARLISGLEVNNTAELSNLIFKLMV